MLSKRKTVKSRRPKWWDLSKRTEKRCERCGRKIKMGRYCYYCGKYRGLW